MLEKLFKLDDHGTTVRRECYAGVTTFLTMAYIIFVNPQILSATGMDKGALITATILASFFGTTLVGLWANVPFAMAPGMGLNAFFAFSLVLGRQVSWQTALGVVFVSGVVFLLLTLLGFRERIVHAIPIHLRLAIAAGIGVFIAFVGLQGMGLIVRNEATLVGLGSLSLPLVLSLVGLSAILLLEQRRVPGAILIGISLATLLGLFFGAVPLPTGNWLGLPPSLAPIAFKLDVVGALRFGMWGAVFSFMFVDLFDSVGTIVACSYEADLVKPDGRIDKIDRVLEADAVATVVGAVLGTSTTTSYIESGAGIAAGGRTGLSAVVTACCFLVALFVTPLIGIVPGFATAPALVMVGILMFRSVRLIEFSELHIAIPAFLTIVLMPLTYSISTGLAFGFLAHILACLVSGRAKDVSPLLWLIGIGAASDLSMRLVG